MAINPEEINTLRLGQLPPNAFALTDLIPHEIGTDLNQGTVQQLADVIGSYLGSLGALAFNPITVLDGQNLPATTTNEWILVGKGTFINVGGGADITTTQGLNAIVSNGSFWSLSVEIPIIVDPPEAMISQTVTNGVTNYSPSEDAVYDAIIDAAENFVTKLFTIRLAGDGQDYDLPSGAVAFKGYINDGVQHLEQAGFESDLNTFTQTGVTITFKKTITTGQRIIIDYYI